MRSWLTYIFLSMVACATVLTSCNKVLDEEGIAECDDRTTVRLTISFGGDGGPMSRDVGNTSAPKDDDLDYTTSGQAEITEGDIYALVVDDDNDDFLYRIKDLTVTSDPAEGDTWYTRTLEGTMIQTNNDVKIVLLANLIQQNIVDNNNSTLDSKTKIENFIDSYEGRDVSELYDALVYNYDGTDTPWTLTEDNETLTEDNARRIPMWGESQETTVPPTESIDLTCYLYRAVAKVQIWVNMKQGIEGFVINSITVNNIHKKGYCVSQAGFDNNSLHYNNINFKPYAAPWVPTTDPGSQSVTYSPTGDGATKAFSDMIYIPEKANTSADAVTITIGYTYNEEQLTGIIEFEDSETGNLFNVIRNHSYIFNINKVEEQTGKLYYYVDWEEEEVKIEFN